MEPKDRATKNLLYSLLSAEGSYQAQKVSMHLIKVTVVTKNDLSHFLCPHGIFCQFDPYSLHYYRKKGRTKAIDRPSNNTGELLNSVLIRCTGKNSTFN